MANRINKSADQWTNEELIAWAKGEAKTGSTVSDNSVAEEAVARFELTFEGEVTIDAVKARIVELTPVEGEEGPVGETPTEEPTETPTEAPTQMVEENLEKEAVVAPAEVPAAPVVKSVSTTMEVIQNNLNNYLTYMAPGRSHSGNEGVINQVGLYRTIQTILRLKGNDFNNAYGQLLAVVNENIKGHFSERYLFRYFDRLNIPAQDQKNFERILNLIVTTANPGTRQAAIKQVDLAATLEGFRDHEMEQRVIAFYTNV